MPEENKSINIPTDSPIMDEKIPPRPPTNEPQPGMGPTVWGHNVVHYRDVGPDDLIKLGIAVVVTVETAIVVSAQVLKLAKSIATADVKGILSSGKVIIGNLAAWWAIVKDKTKALQGQRGDDILYSGWKIVGPNGEDVPIKDVDIAIVDKDGDFLHFGKDIGDLPGTSAGGNVVRKHVNGPSDAGVQVRWWFDFSTGLRYRVVYFVNKQKCQLKKAY